MQLLTHLDPKEATGVVISVGFFVMYFIEMAAGRIFSTRRPLRDTFFTLAGMSAHVFLSGPIIGLAAGWVVLQIWPSESGALAHIGFWPAFAALFFADEFLHYWLHRYAHEWRWLWKIPRTHHTAMNMNVGVAFRYNIFWVLLLPQAWLSAFALYVGQGEALMAALLITFFVNVLTHASFRWDLALRRRFPWSEGFWFVLEHLVTLPDTHHAHHAYGKSAHPNGNYAVTVFLFDVLFGTAKFPRQEQATFGLPISSRLHWAEELFWPIVRKPLLPRPDKIGADARIDQSSKAGFFNRSS